MTDAIALKPAVAIFRLAAASFQSGRQSLRKRGITVIDNFSAWRMDPSKKLIVPEINADSLTVNDKIIANSKLFNDPDGCLNKSSRKKI